MPIRKPPVVRRGWLTAYRRWPPWPHPPPPWGRRAQRARPVPGIAEQHAWVAGFTGQQHRDPATAVAGPDLLCVRRSRFRDEPPVRVGRMGVSLDGFPRQDRIEPVEQLGQTDRCHGRKPRQGSGARSLRVAGLTPGPRGERRVDSAGARPRERGIRSQRRQRVQVCQCPRQAADPVEPGALNEPDLTHLSTMRRASGVKRTASSSARPES